MHVHVISTAIICGGSTVRPLHRVRISTLIFGLCVLVIRFASIIRGSLMQTDIAQQDDGVYFGHKVDAIFECGNDPYNHESLLNLFSQLWMFSRVNRVYVNDIDFRGGKWLSARRVIIECDWIEADDWESVENIPINEKKYSEWTGQIIRGAETVALLLSVPVRLIRFDFNWIKMDQFIVTYHENI